MVKAGTTGLRKKAEGWQVETFSTFTKKTTQQGMGEEVNDKGSYAIKRSGRLDTTVRVLGSSQYGYSDPQQQGEKKEETLGKGEGGMMDRCGRCVVLAWGDSATKAGNLGPK